MYVCICIYVYISISIRICIYDQTLNSNRRHGADLCYTPMIHSRLWVESANFRREIYSTCRLSPYKHRMIAFG